jgi:hypothetical protein
MPTSIVTLNGVSKSVIYYSDTYLGIVVTADELPFEGNLPIVVTNPSPGGGSSNGFNLRIRAPDDVPDDDYDY